MDASPFICLPLFSSMERISIFFTSCCPEKDNLAFRIPCKGDNFIMEDVTFCQQFGELECECVGIPELAPGRFVEVEELSSQADRKYYITYVRHVLDEDGYRTYLKAGVNSL